MLLKTAAIMPCLHYRPAESEFLGRRLRNLHFKHAFQVIPKHIEVLKATALICVFTCRDCYKPNSPLILPAPRYLMCWNLQINTPFEVLVQCKCIQLLSPLQFCSDTRGSQHRLIFHQLYVVYGRLEFHALGLRYSQLPFVCTWLSYSVLHFLLCPMSMFFEHIGGYRSLCLIMGLGFQLGFLGIYVRLFTW